MLEAASVTNLNYHYEEHQVISPKVYNLLREAGADDESARTAINVMEDNGILFRERENKK